MKIASEKSNTHSQRPTFLFLGRFVHLKQPKELLNIFKILISSNYRCKLIMFGKGPLYEDLQKYVIDHELQNDVEIRGFSRNPWVDLNENIEALILPSLSEGVSQAAMEALFLGIPVIARDIDSNFELIENKKTGVLFKSDKELLEVLKHP